MPLTRAGIGALVGRTRKRLAVPDPALEQAFAAGMDAFPIAEHTDAANTQHYEVPAEFFRLCLGPRRKYSCCYYDSPATYAGAGRGAGAGAHLRACRPRRRPAHPRARLRLGLALPCGWPSIIPTPRSPPCRTRRASAPSSWARRRKRGLGNLTIVTADMNAFATEEKFDRIVSVEMFEHMANWRALLARARGWLVPDGRLFVHVFTHAHAPYRFDHADKSDWIAQHFFTGGIMPSRGLIGALRRSLRRRGDVGLERHPLRPHRARLAGELRRQPAGGRLRVLAGGLRARRAPLAAALAAVLPRHRGPVRPRRRHGLGRHALPAQAGKPEMGALAGARTWFIPGRATWAATYVGNARPPRGRRPMPAPSSSGGASRSIPSMCGLMRRARRVAGLPHLAVDNRFSSRRRWSRDSARSAAARYSGPPASPTRCCRRRPSAQARRSAGS